MAATAPAPRRRRTPEEAEREILDSAERLLKERPPSELTVSAVMAGTTLTRNAFYVYFRDRYDLIAQLVARLRAGADAAMDAFAGGARLADPAAREALAAAARLYAEHGEVLRALALAADDDPVAARAWEEFVEPSHRIMTEMVRSEVAAGRITGIDPEPTVRALVAMNRACFFDCLVGKPDPPLDALVDTLHAIWTRALYGSG